jgi:hypothetical protein
MVDWRRMEEQYRRAGIDAVRVPIEDFNGTLQQGCESWRPHAIGGSERSRSRSWAASTLWDQLLRK